MAKFKLTPAPGYIFVSPIVNRVDEITATMGGGESLKSGKIVKMPMETNKVKAKDMEYCRDEISLKIGTVVFYKDDTPWVFTINDENYHLISTYSVKAKEG